MSGLLKEQLMPLGEVARLFPTRAGRHVNPATIWRWVTVGIRVSSGETVRLVAVRAGRRWLTTMGAVERFVSMTTPTFDAADPNLTPSPVVGHRRYEDAVRELDKIGIGTKPAA